MFEYFENNYAWNLTTLTLIEDVGTISQPAEALEKAAEYADQPSDIANHAWEQAMSALGEKTEKCANRDLDEGHAMTAARKYHRAAMYYIRAERMLSHADPRRLVAYERALVNYRKARELGQDGVEFVDIPYESGVIPGLLIPATTDGRPSPIVIHLQGFDSLKETQWPCLQEYRRRGISVLIVDQPGAGGALRLSKIAGRFDTEVYVSVIIDWIMARPDLATDRIGICGVSMGGYFAPRAAAFESRIKACAAWGALYDAGSLSAPIVRGKEYTTIVNGKEHATPSVPSMIDHAMWVFGVDTPAGFGMLANKMTLAGVVNKITCPLLVMHGENDRQVPVQQAISTYNEATVADKTLKVFGQDEGGVEHCQIDNKAIAADYLSDWFAEKL